jgi:hypothetical protein
MTGVVDDIAATGDVTATTLIGSGQATRLRSLAGDERWDRGLRAAYLRLLDHLEAVAGDEVLRFGAWHGDWVPWNVALSDGALQVWDWEHYASGGVLVGCDVAHWHFQLAFVSDRRPVGEAFARARSAAAADVTTLQDSTTAPALAVGLHALELTARYERMRIEGAGATPGFFPEVTPALDALRSAAG